MLIVLALLESGSGVYYTVRETSFAALVVHYDAVTSQLGDRWALAVVGLTTGKSGVQPLTLINVAATWNAPECSWAVLVRHQPCYPPTCCAAELLRRP